jgi:DNA adenine methylase
MIRLMKSPFPQNRIGHYPGGKGLSFRNIINLMPPHARYIETHLGGGAVLRNKRPALQNVGIDIDPRVTELWRDRREFTVFTGCVHDILPDLQPDDGTLVYADPPYLPSTRRTPRYYRHDYTAADHERLLKLLLTLPAMVIISGYRSDLYEEHLGRWHRTTYEASTHRGLVEEVAWTNFKPGAVLHDYRHVGSNFREREGFKRRAGSLASALREAGEMELNSALASLGDSRPDAIIAAARRVA